MLIVQCMHFKRATVSCRLCVARVTHKDFNVAYFLEAVDCQLDCSTYTTEFEA